MIDGKREPYEDECAEFANDMMQLSRKHKHITAWCLVCLDKTNLPCVMSAGIDPNNLQDLFEHMSNIRPQETTTHEVPTEQ